MTNITNTSILQYTNNYLVPDVYVYVIGIISGVFLVTMPIPQIVKMCKTKSAKDVSYKYLWIKLLGRVILSVYGIIIQEYPIIIPAPISVCEMICMIVMKYIYDKGNLKKGMMDEILPYEPELCEVEVDTETDTEIESNNSEDLNDKTRIIDSHE